MQLSPVEHQLFTLLFLAAVMHSFFLAALLFVKSHQERGLGWLGIMMLPVSVLLLTYLLYLTEVVRSYPNLFGVFVPFFYTIGPAYYFFVRRSSKPADRYRWFDLLHLLPLLYVTWEWWPVYSWPAEVKLDLIDRAYIPHRGSLKNLFLGNRHVIIILAYVFFSYRTLKTRLRTEIHNTRRLRWLLQFTRVFGTFLAAKLVLIGLFWTLNWEGSSLELLLVLLTGLAIHLLGYIVLGRDRVLPELIAPSENEKYATSPLDDAQIAALQAQIIRYMETAHPWREADFSIHHLSAALNIPRHHLSQVLNEGLKINFYDFICQYRIQAVKRRFQRGDAQKFSILGIATDCGFGSKSSFNRAFKKVTGLTPSAYLKALRVEK